MYSAQVGRNVSIAGRSIDRSITVTATGRAGLNKETIADGVTDKQFNIAIDVSAVKYFYIVSDQDITIETNSGSTPDDTLNLKAGKPYEWHVDDEDSFRLGTDVTAFFGTNASGATATIECECLQDATP